MKFSEVKIGQEFETTEWVLNTLMEKVPLGNCLKINNDGFVSLRYKDGCAKCDMPHHYNTFKNIDFEVELISKCGNCVHCRAVQGCPLDEHYSFVDTETFSCSDFTKKEGV